MAALLCVVMASVGLSWAAAPRASHAASTVTSSDTSHVFAFQRTGPLGQCDANECGESSHTVRVAMPAGHLHYSCTITVSFTYRTTGKAQFALTTTLWAAHLKTKLIVPASRPVAPSTTLDSRTVVFRPELLDGGKHYNLILGAKITGRTSGKQTFDTSQVLVDVEATPVD